MCQELYIHHFTNSWQQLCNPVTFSWVSERFKGLGQSPVAPTGWAEEGAGSTSLLSDFGAQDAVPTAPGCSSSLHLDTRTHRHRAENHALSLEQRGRSSRYTTNKKAEAAWGYQQKLGAEKTEMLGHVKQIPLQPKAFLKERAHWAKCWPEEGQALGRAVWTPSSRAAEKRELCVHSPGASCIWVRETKMQVVLRELTLVIAKAGRRRWRGGKFWDRCRVQKEETVPTSRLVGGLRRKQWCLVADY